MKKILLNRGLLASAFGLFLASHAQAQIEKADNTDDLSTGASWVGDVAPGPGDVAQWDSTVSSASASETYASNVSWDGISILTPSSAIDIESANNSVDGVSVGADGITLTGQNLSINTGSTGTADGNAVDLTAAQAWSVGASLALVTGQVNLNNDALTISGPGTVSVSGTTNSGTLNLNGVSFDDSSGIGSGITVNLNGATFTSTNGTIPMGSSYYNGSNNWNGSVSITGMNSQSATSSAWTLNGSLSGSGLLEFNSPASNTNYINGDMSNFTGTIISNGAGTTVNAPLAGSDENGSTVNFVVNAGASIAFDNSGASSGTTYMGSISGTGELYANAFGHTEPGPSPYTATLVVGSLNTADTFGGTIEDRPYTDWDPLTIQKVGTGTLIFSSGSSLQYHGGTQVMSGTLQVDSNLTTSAVSVSHGATFQGTGTIGGTTAAYAGADIGTITVDGTIIGGDNNGTSAGSMGIAGNLTLEADSTLYANAYAAGNNDKLTLSSGITSTLDAGTLVLNLHYAAVTGDSFVVIDPTAGGTITGDFGLIDIEQNGTMTADVGTFNDTTGAVTITSIGSGAVPEPGVNALLFVGAGLLGLVQIRRMRQAKS